MPFQNDHLRSKDSEMLKNSEKRLAAEGSPMNFFVDMKRKAMEITFGCASGSFFGRNADNIGGVRGKV